MKKNKKIIKKVINNGKKMNFFYIKTNLNYF